MIQIIILYGLTSCLLLLCNRFRVVHVLNRPWIIDHHSLFLRSVYTHKLLHVYGFLSTLIRVFKHFKFIFNTNSLNLVNSKGLVHLFFEGWLELFVWSIKVLKQKWPIYMSFENFSFNWVCHGAVGLLNFLVFNIVNMGLILLFREPFMCTLMLSTIFTNNEICVRHIKYNFKNY